MTDVPAAEWEWYQNFYEARVMPRVGKDLGECEWTLFWSWLGGNDPELYTKISAAEEVINCLWISRGEKEAFKTACKEWYRLLMDAKKGFEEHNARLRRESLQPAQKRLTFV